jgi:hypothetical protein
MSAPRVFACLGLLALAPLTGGQTPPTSYTITLKGNSPDAITNLYRNGAKVLAIINEPAQGSTPAMRIYSLYDLAAGINYTWSPGPSPIQCSSGSFSGDWSDPFAMTAELKKDIASGDLKPAGAENIDGIPTQIYAGSNAQATEKIWFDQKDGLVIRAQLAGSGTPQITLVDITKVSFAPPDPMLFVLPSACAGQKPPRTPAQLITDETGDDPANFVNGIDGPGSRNSCSVVLRVVQAKTMAPISNVQVAIDTQYDQNDPNPPHYHFGVADDGSETFSGGHLHEISTGIHNGIVSLGTVPPYFNLVVNVAEPGRSGGVGLAYRQCFAPTTVLLYVVKDDGQSGESADLLWVKAGRYAVPPTD